MDTALPAGVNAEAFARAAAEFRGEVARAKPNARSSKFAWRDHTMTAAELRDLRFPAIGYIVPGILPEGLALLAGKPKVGKSWAALEVALAVAGGSACLGNTTPSVGDVLYAALEDNPRRLQRRVDKLISPFSDAWPERLTLTTAWRRLDQGGVDDIREWISDAVDPKLVILDTLAGVRPVKTQQGYTEDYEALAALHRLANDTGIANPCPPSYPKSRERRSCRCRQRNFGLSGVRRYCDGHRAIL